MKPCAARSVSRVDERKHIENARFAIALGASFALLCAVVFDSRESQAANGLFELLFGGPGSGYVHQSPSISFNGNTHTSGRHRHARRGRTHEASARRHVDRRWENRRAIVARVAERRHVAAVRRPSERRSPAPETASSLTRAASGATASQNAICVRACDGFYFRIVARSSESAAQETCERLCPGSRTTAFLLPSGATRAEDAVAVKGGETYARFVARIKSDSSREKNCGCPQTAENLSGTSAFLSDLTLRPGDTVVTPDGVRVLRRGSHYPFKGSDFLSLAETRSLPRATRGALAAIDRALQIPYGRLAVASGDRRRHRANANL